MCLKSCKSCPINITTQEGEEADMYGCLPYYAKIMKWYEDTSKVWACHANNKKVCSGFIIRAKANGVKININENTKLITEDHTLEDIYKVD